MASRLNASRNAKRIVALGVWVTPFVILALAVSLHAQIAGTMSGYVKDTSGAVIPGAKVTARLVARGTTFATQTNSEGFYNFTALEPGVYNLTAEKAGFKRSVRVGLTLTVRQNLRADVTLEVGAVTQTVTVRSAAPLVDTTSGTISGLVGPERIVDLPLNGRSVFSLAGLLPGVLNVSAPSYQPNVLSGSAMNVNGGRENENFYTLDGAYFINSGRNLGLNYPPPDAIQEFRIQTADFDAQDGYNPGSQMAVVSKAGTNQFHGDAYDFLRNTVLDTRNFFAATVPSLIQNQFGGTAGGPIKKNKLFYFGSFQGLIELPQAVTTEAIVPTPAERNGNFSALLPGTVLSDPVSPLTGLPFTTSTGAPCVANNIIAPSCISLVTQKLLPVIPQSASGAVVSLAESPLHDYNYFGRLDWNLSPKNVLFGHAFVEHNGVTDPTAQASFTDINSIITTDETDMVTVNDTYTLRPNLLNQALVSFVRSGTRTNPSATLAPSAYGINMPQYFPVGEPAFTVSGAFSTVFGFQFSELISNNYQFRDSVTWIHGRHTFIFGGEDLFPLSYNNFAFQEPSFTFSGSRSGNALADFMLGAYGSLNTAFGVVDETANTNAPDLFFQDEFKATPRAPLTAGLRWEPDLFFSLNHNKTATFAAGRQSTVDPTAPLGILFPGDPGVPPAMAPADMNNLAPRFGFAWDVFGNGKTSIRGGAGVFFEHNQGDYLDYGGPPYSGTTTTYNGLASDPFASVGVTPPPVAPSGEFGCTKISAFPGESCPLFPLPIQLEGAVSPNMQTPYVGEWNLDIQHQLTPSTMIEAGYIGNRAIKLNALADFNPARFIPGTTYNAATGVETTNSSLENVNNRAIYEPGILSTDSWQEGNDYRSWYDSFQAEVTHRMSHGVSVIASYTLSKALDVCSTYDEGGGDNPNPFNIEGSMKGRATWDRRNAFVASYLWSPPVHFSYHWKNLLLGGWTLSGITTLQSGEPITFFNPVDVAVNGTDAKEHAFLTGQPIASSHPTVSEFFNTNAFVNPLCTFVPQPFNPQVVQQENCTPDGIKYSLLGTYGQSGRDILSGPGYSDTDFGVLRDFTFKERYKVEFRGEFFNLFNQVNFGQPGNTVTSATFGRLVSANSGRIIQFALKFFW